MKKIDLIRSIAVKSNLKKEQIAIVVEGVMEAIAEALHQGESVTLVGFGTFEVKERKARKGYNLSTGEIMTIPGKKTVRLILRRSIRIPPGEIVKVLIKANAHL